MAHGMVRDVFMIILFVTAAAMMYFIFFGTPNPNAYYYAGKDAGVSTVENGSVTSQTWQGVLWWAARAIENPIAFYYYNYCLTPNVHGTDYLDMELGTKVYNKTKQTDVTVQDYRNQSTSRTDMSNGVVYKYPSEYYYNPLADGVRGGSDTDDGTTTTYIDMFTNKHYHYRDINSDF